MDFTRKLGRWLANFLTNMRQTVKSGRVIEPVGADGVVHSPRKCPGTLFFLIFISDMGQTEEGEAGAQTLIYIDDGKCFRKISSLEDVQTFQGDLEVLYVC